MKKTVDKMVEAFAELMIQKINEMEVDWTKPWVSVGGMGLPQNISGRHYNGINSFMLMLIREMKGYRTPVFMTFQQAKKEGWDIRKGEKGVPVELWRQVYRDEHGKKLTYEEYNELSDEEKQKCKSYPASKVYTVFNAEQTLMSEVSPERWQKLLDTFSVPKLVEKESMLSCPELDFMVEHQRWVCPLEPKESDKAYYSPVSDRIVIPLKAQFVDGERYYGTMLHEMAHSTGHESRLNRELENKFGDAAYGREELVAEMTSAMMASQLGIIKGIEPDNVAYLKGWLKNIKEQPEFLRTVMSDVNKASAMIQEKVMDPEMAEEIKQAAMASIDRFLEEKQAQASENRAPLMTEEQIREKNLSIRKQDKQAENRDENQVPVVDEAVMQAIQKAKASSSGIIPWVIANDTIHIVGDDALTIQAALKLHAGKALTPDGQDTHLLTFERSKLDLYLPQVVSKGHRLVICEAQLAEQVRQAVPVDQGLKLHMAHLGNGITAWEEGDNEYTAFISPERELKLYKEFAPHNLAKLEGMAQSGNLLVGNKGSEYLALRPLNPATRFIYQPYGGQTLPLSLEQVGERSVICYGRKAVQFGAEEPKQFTDYPLLQRPQHYIVSVTGLDNVRQSLAYMHKLDIDTARLNYEYCYDVLQQAEQELSPLQKEVKRLSFQVSNQGTPEKPSMAITAFSDDPDKLDPQRQLPRYAMREGAMLYSQPSVNEVNQGLSTERQVLSQPVYVRVNGRDNLPDTMKVLAQYGVATVPGMEEEMQQAFDEGQQMPRFVAARDRIYLEVKQGMVSSMEFNISEYSINEVPLLEVRGGMLRNASLYDREMESAYLVMGFKADETLGSFSKVPAGQDALQEAQRRLEGFLDRAEDNLTVSARIIEVDRDLKDSVRYRMAGRDELSAMLNDTSIVGFKEIARFPVPDRAIKADKEQITNHKTEDTMAKKTQEQVQEPVENKQASEKQEKQEAQQTAGQEQAAERQLRDGASVFQRKGKDGQPISGVYGVSIVKDGVRSEVATITKEDRDQYFKDVKGKTGEEAGAVRQALAEKYIGPDGKRIEAPKAEAKEAQQTEEKPKKDFVLNHAPEDKAQRITEPRVFKKDGEEQYRIRCKIDGEQQLSRTISDAKTAAFFKGYKGMPAEEQLQRRVDLAAVVFGDVLRTEKQEQSRGMGR